MDIGIFGFIIMLILGLSLIDAGTKILVPLSKRLADLIAESVREKREGRGAVPATPAGGEELAAALDEMERRLVAIEDRLDFLEELRAPDRPRSLTGGRPRD